MEKLTKILMIAVIAIMASCSKEGPQGPAGTNGTNGVDGNANVKYSDWFTPSPWVATTAYGTKDFAYTKTDAAITQSIIDNGVVLVFGKLAGYNPSIWPSTRVSQLPIVVNYVSSGAQIDTWSAYLTLGTLTIDFKNNNNYYNNISITNQFRYVIIPSSSHLRLSKPLQSMTYDEICSLYNIPK